MSRCSACNKILKPSEIIWYPEQQKHEEFCLGCRDLLLMTLADEGESVEANEEYIDSLIGKKDASSNSKWF